MNTSQYGMTLNIKQKDCIFSRGKCKPDVTRTRSRWTSHTGAVFRRLPPEAIDGWSLTDLLTNLPTSLNNSPFPFFLEPVAIAQSHKSTTGNSGIGVCSDWMTWPYCARQFSSSHEAPVPKMLMVTRVYMFWITKCHILNFHGPRIVKIWLPKLSIGKTIGWYLPH